MLNVRELLTDEEIAAAYPLAVQLRVQLREDEFLTTVRARHQQTGYRLWGGFELAGAGDEGRLVVLAGVPPSAELWREVRISLSTTWSRSTLNRERGTQRPCCAGWPPSPNRAACRRSSSTAGIRPSAFTAARFQSADGGPLLDRRRRLAGRRGYFESDFEVLLVSAGRVWVGLLVGFLQPPCADMRVDLRRRQTLVTNSS